MARPSGWLQIVPFAPSDVATDGRRLVVRWRVSEGISALTARLLLGLVLIGAVPSAPAAPEAAVESSETERG